MFAKSIIFLIFAITFCNGACQTPGNALCWIAVYDITIGDPCCEGSACFPWLGDIDPSPDNWCQYIAPLQEGDFCGDKVGFCDVGLTCTGQYCKKETETTASSTTVATGSTSTDECQQPGSALDGAQCSYVVDGMDHDFGDPCCPGSECLQYDTSAVEPYFRYCMNPEDLAEGDLCANKVGRCGPGLNCQDGFCRPVSGVECQAPGYALCRILDGWQEVGGPCCAGSECLPWTYGTPHDFYCQKTGLGMGEFCGEHMGQCEDDLDCIFDICLPRTTIASTTTTPPPDDCKQPGADSEGAICFDVVANNHTDCCNVPEPTICDFYPPNSPDDYNKMYCQFKDPIPSGGACANKEGICIGGAACLVAGTCP